MKFFEWLDEKQFLRMKIWDFSFRSLLREYGWNFLYQVMCKHPIRTSRGLKKYRKMDTCAAGATAENQQIWHGGEQSIVGVGFCLKPLTPECISGRSNHDCYFFENNLHLQEKPIPLCCRSCSIKRIGILASANGSNFYIMTSARDILYDMFLPALQSGRFTHGLYTLCRYSFEPFKIALCISGIQGNLYPFEKGDCRDYPTWLRADVGIKDEQTAITDHDFLSIEEQLSQTAEKKAITAGYHKKGNIFFLQ